MESINILKIVMQEGIWTDKIIDIKIVKLKLKKLQRSKVSIQGKSQIFLLMMCILTMDAISKINMCGGYLAITQCRNNFSQLLSRRWP